MNPNWRPIYAIPSVAGKEWFSIRVPKPRAAYECQWRELDEEARRAGHGCGEDHRYIPGCLITILLETVDLATTTTGAAAK